MTHRYIQALSLCLISASLLYCGPTEEINKAIQYSLAGQNGAAKEILENLLTENLTDTQKSAILYNLGNIALHEGNVDEAERRLQNIDLDPMQPFFTKNLLQTYITTLLVLIERDIDLYRRGDRSFNIRQKIKERITTLENTLVHIKKDDPLFPHLERHMKRLEIEANELLTLPSEGTTQEAIIASCIHVLHTFERDLASENEDFDPIFIQSQGKMISQLLRSVYEKIFSNSLPDEYARSLQAITDCTHTDTLLQELLFARFLLQIQTSHDPLKTAFEEIYAASLLPHQSSKQIQKRTAYTRHLLETKPQIIHTHLPTIQATRHLIHALDTFPPKELLLYFLGLELPITQLFIQCIENGDPQKGSIQALLDLLQLEATKEASEAMKLLQRVPFDTTHAFFAYNPRICLHYQIATMMKTGIDKKQLSLILQEIQARTHSDFTKDWISTIDFITKNQHNPLSQFAISLCLHWLVERIPAHKTSYPTFLQNLIDISQLSQSYLEMLTSRMQLSYSAKKEDLSVFITPSLLSEKELFASLKNINDYQENDKTGKASASVRLHDILQSLLLQYPYYIKDASTFRPEVNLSLEKKTLALLQELLLEWNNKQRAPGNSSTQTTPPQLLKSPSSQEQNRSIQMLQEMHAQDLEFDVKKKITQTTSSTKPW